MVWHNADSEPNHSDDDSDADSDSDPEISDIAADGEFLSATLPRARVTFESVMGLLAAFFIGLPSPLFAAVAVAHIPRPLNLNPILPIIVLALTGYLSVIVVRLASRAVEGDSPHSPSFALIPSAGARLDYSDDEVFLPLPLAMAIRLPNWRAITRPFIAIWWLAHFIVAALLGHAISARVIAINNGGLLIAIPVTLLMTTAFLLAANLYLVLAIAVCVRQPGVWVIAWRHRILIDLVIAGTMLFMRA